MKNHKNFIYTTRININYLTLKSQKKNPVHLIHNLSNIRQIFRDDTTDSTE